jgi:hemoglobin-like flavoprotein
MTPKQISLVQSTWEVVLPISRAAATIFYDKLFAADPSLRPLFKGDLEEQKVKLMKMIGVAVNSLERLDDIVPAVQDLGRRHRVYGVEPAHYATVGGALLATLEQGLGSAFTPEVKEAWATVYGVLAGAMQKSAASVAA